MDESVGTPLSSISVNAFQSYMDVSIVSSPVGVVVVMVSFPVDG